MPVFLLRVFQSQVLLQCQFVLRASAELDAAVVANDRHGVFYAIQNLLSAGANISKALWGSGGKLAAERQDLRNSIGVLDDSPLREVTMRNNYEHFDERLDRGWREADNHNSVDLNLGSRASIGGIHELGLRRHYDPATGEAWFWSEDFNLRRPINDVNQIIPKLQEELRKPWAEA